MIFLAKNDIFKVIDFIFMPDNARVSLIIYGLVQGVFFRYEAEKMARKLGLTGWAKNRSDGTVEVLAEGNKFKLEELIKWCEQGPRSAQVEKVEINWSPYVGEFKSFEII